MHVRLEKCFDEEKNATFLRLLELCRFDLNQFSKPMIQAHLCRKKETSISTFIICSTSCSSLPAAEAIASQLYRTSPDELTHFKRHHIQTSLLCSLGQCNSLERRKLVCKLLHSMFYQLQQPPSSGSNSKRLQAPVSSIEPSPLDCSHMFSVSLSISQSAQQFLQKFQ